MTNQKGTRYETEVRHFLGQWWPLIVRRRTEGSRDCGEFAGGPHHFGGGVECKAEQRYDLPRYLREAHAQAIHTGGRFSAAIVKRRRKPVGRSLVVMELYEWAQLVSEHEEMWNRLEGLEK